MKKIALVTIHYANSYGGCLQALASQTVLSRFGEVSIVDYKTTQLANTMKLLRFSKSPRTGLHLIKDIGRYFPRKRLLDRFHHFMQENYNLTKPYSSQGELQKLNNDFDIFVCGSDQIWNPVITGAFDKNYMLDFVKSKQKVAFSTSAGSYVHTGESKDYLKTSLNTFSSLSFREEDTAERMRVLSGRDDIECTLDPTLLLSREEWSNLLNLPDQQPPYERYIFVYTLKKDRLVYEIVNKVAKKFNLKIVAIDQDPFLLYKTDRHYRDASPLEYMSLMNNASFVVTNSFHGTAFATNFGIPFVSIKPETGTNRIKGFLDSLGLVDRLVENTKDLDNILLKEIDFEPVHAELEKLKKNTFRYLEKALA
ncbi:polysaccharide pyruvyl transferase family protein [Vreelandella titanicae]|uniref:Polysaccharide pyruvyl transferase family protein n=1 Tax=Vreelandella titanicae TaxID=664683 RepID=A0A558J1R3_9GAMM|nr:polysaccharide pyruvyl transferase family protein [Halomonas titanicae]TVU87608.1 polysaccharide pyruvyl transferase family protein [Halomonas titanicae]